MSMRKVFNTFLFCVILLCSNIVLAADIIKTEQKVKSGDGLISILKNNDINKTDINNLIYKTKDSKKLHNLKVGQRVIIYKTKTGSLNKLILDVDKVNAYIVSRNDSSSFEIKTGKFKTNQINQYVVGTVKYSVNKTLKEMGLTKDQRKTFIDMFGTEINFKSIKKGTKLVAVFPEFYTGKTKVETGKLISAEISYKNDITQVFAFNDHNGNRSYYLRNGKPTTEGINREPLEYYSRISSGFSKVRKHPVLGYVRAHKGTDYAAPRGTPIYAAASGKIALKDYQEKGYGKVLVINHSDGYSTLYAHMHNFKKDIYSGKTVKKGDVIGYVGTTGISTGNHLHFEIRRNGKHYDPRKVKLPSGDKISKSDVSKFKKFTKKHSEGIKLAKILNQTEGRNRIAIRNKK